MPIQLPEQLNELVQYLAIQLTIPFAMRKQNCSATQLLCFGYQCVNTLMQQVDQHWEPIPLPPISSQQNQQQSQQINSKEWKQFINIVQSCFLQEDDDNQICKGEDVNIDNLIEVFGVLCHGCESVRNSLEYLMANEKITEELKKTHNKDVKKSNKNNSQKVRPKTSKPTKSASTTKYKKQQHKISKNKKIQKIETGELQKQIIQEVKKTMLKTTKSVQNPKFAAKTRDKQANQAVEKAKRRFDYTIKNTQKQNKMNQRNKNKKTIFNKAQGNQIDNHYLKYIKTKHQSLNQQIQSEQLRYYLQLRDKKIAYIRHIHKLMEKLQKERALQLHKQQQQQHLKCKKELSNKIQQVDTLFDQNIGMIKEEYEKKRKVKVQENVEEIKVCREIQKSVREKKQKQLSNMKDLWAAQCQKLQLITGDQEKMKNKLIEIYRKNRV